MMFRLADIMCARHKALILDTRLWPQNYTAGNHNPGNNSCENCADVGRQAPTGIPTVLPHLEPVEHMAFHESGHAVVYLHLGVTVDYAALEASPDGAEGSQAHVSVDASGCSLVGLWAGTAAARRWLLTRGVSDDADLIDVINGGHLDAREIHESGFGRRDVNAARDHADGLVNQNWSAIERVAAALLIRGRLTGDEIAELAGCGVVS
jgi:hypothetical protein